MRKSAVSLFVFALYVGILGIVFILIPNVLLKAVSGLSTTEVWIRLFGMLLLYLGFYYTQAARKEMKDFFRWTVYTRSTVIVFAIIFVVLRFAKPPLVMFALVDLLGAIWTGLALRSERAIS